MKPFIRRGTMLAAPALLAALAIVSGCNTDRILKVVDPDIINPADVNTLDGAQGLRLGALARFESATSGGEGVFFYGGLLADEWRSSDTFIQRNETDARSITVVNAGEQAASNSLITTAARDLFRSRLGATLAIAGLKQWGPTQLANIAQMYFVKGYAENLVGENFCNGVVFSDASGADIVYGSPVADSTAFRMAIADADSAITTVASPGALVDNAARIVKGRALMNLAQYAAAAAAVTAVPTAYVYQNFHSQTSFDNAIWALNINIKRYSVADKEGINGLPFRSANDPRVPTLAPVTGFDGATPSIQQQIWKLRTDAVTIASGIDARMIEAEAALNANDVVTYLAKLNEARATKTGLAPLTDPAPAGASDADAKKARVKLLMTERGFWFFGTGHRLGDLRRMIRQYGFNQNEVFPIGSTGRGGNYGTDVNLPEPQAEQNNPNYVKKGCTNRDA